MSEKAEKIFIFISLSAIYFFSIVHRVGISVVAEDMISEFSSTATLTGLMSSAYFWSYAAAQIPVGIALDRTGVRKTIGVFGILAIAGNLIFALGATISIVTIGRALVGFGVGGFYVSCLKALAKYFDPARFATLTGLLTALGNFGAFFASAPLALISVSLGGWRPAYLVIFAAMTIFILLSWIALRHEPHEEKIKNQSIFKDLKTVFSYKQFLLIMMIPFLGYGVYISFQGLWVGPFLADVYGFDTATIGFFLTFISIGFIISSPLGGYLSDKVLQRRRPVLMAGLGMSLAFWLVLITSGGALSPIYLITMFLLIGFATGFIYVFMSMSKELFPAKISGVGIASFNQFNFIGGGFYEFFMGFVLDLTYGGAMGFPAYQLVFIISAISVGIAMVLTFVAKETFGGKAMDPRNQSESNSQEPPIELGG
jgi:predicted MFS family arabinose efflux permease